MRSLLRRLWYLLRERRAQTELRAELAFHRDMKARELEEAGVDAAEARRRASRALGNTTLAHDQVRDVWLPHWLQGITQDFRLAVRTLAATPSVSAAAILSLSLGIGANTAIFSLINSLLLRELPGREPGRLVILTDGTDQHWDHWDYAVWRQIHSRTQLFDGTLAWAGARFDLASGGESQYINGIWVSGSFFDVLGVPAALGRTISESDDGAGGSSAPVAVISYDFWQHHFGGDPGVIGRSLTLDRVDFTIIGVAPRGFFGTDVGHAFDIAVPAGSQSGPNVSIMARLRGDQTIDATTRILRGIQPEIREATLPHGWPPAFLEQYLKPPATLFTLERGATGLSALRDRFSRPFLALLIIVALVLLVACANLANLSLARAMTRRRELGMRLALGASTWRIMRQLIAESVVLASAGAALGLAAAPWIAGLLTRQLSTTIPVNGPNAMTGTVFLDTSIDVYVLAYAMALTVLTLVIFGTVPAWRASRLAPLDAIVERRQPRWGRPMWRATDVFIAVQMAVSLALIASASLLIRTLTALETRPLGFDRRGLHIATINPQHASMSSEDRSVLYEQALERVRRLPGVTDAALSFLPAVVDGSMLAQPIQSVSGAGPLPPRGANAALNFVSPGWFQTMKIPLIAGRDIGPDDRIASPPVVVINQAFARRFLGEANPVGHTIKLFQPGPPSPPVEIVGLVGDSVYGAVRSRIVPTIYMPLAQRAGSWLPFLALDLSFRSRSPRVGALEKNVARAIESVSPDVSLTVHPVSDYVSDSLVQERLVALLSEGFAVLALMLAAVGLYGVTAYAVARRRAEIGIRIALGASTRNIVRLTVSRLATLIIIGVAAGTIVTLWASRYIASLLYAVRPHDPASLAAATAVLILTATLAAWTPVRAALRTDPASTIRCN